MTSCIGSLAGGINEGVLEELEEAVKESSIGRLQNLLTENHPSTSQIACRNLLHQAAWLGHHGCVQLLLNYGIEPDRPHTSNGCTPLHLAHFCTIEDRDCYKTVQVLVAAGADINNSGGRKCGRLALEHAVQHQRMDSVSALLGEGSQVTLSCILMSTDVGNFEILEKLLLYGGDCGPKIENIEFWGEPLEKFLKMPLKQHGIFQKTIKSLIRASLTFPYEDTLALFTMHKSTEKYDEKKKEQHSYLTKRRNIYFERQKKIEKEIRRLYSQSDYRPLAVSLIDGLMKNGFRLSRKFAVHLCRNGYDKEIIKHHLLSPNTLLGMCLLIIRSLVGIRNGNVYFAMKILDIPPGLKKIILLDDLR